MDCSVIESKKYKDMYVVSTTDFFYPLVEDPYQQGRIACANVLSDMYAFGIYDIDNVLMLLAASTNIKNIDDRNIVTRNLIKGFDDLCKEAETQVSGGQTVLNPWPIIGGVAKSICKKQDFIMPVNAVSGDVIVLTKPLGTQVAVNVKQWLADEKRWNDIKDIISKEDALRAYHLSALSMSRLNRNAARLMHKYGAHAATDVTGFGIIGHANNLAQNQKASVSFIFHTLPIIRGMKAVDDKKKIFRLLQGFSAETSGGLLICLPKDKASLYCQELEQMDGWQCFIIGDVVAGTHTASISSDVKVIEF